MAERHESVILRIDSTSFAAAMRTAVEAVQALDRTLRKNQHIWRHHRRESPVRSAMHTEYDRRRRARGRRTRRRGGRR